MFDHELKLMRARKHFDDMKVEIDKWLLGEHYTVRTKRDPDRRTVFLATAERPPEDPISLLIGDCLHNLRSALDLLSYALAAKYTSPLPDEIADSSEFPIFGDEDSQGNTGVGSARFNRTDRGVPARGSGLSKIRGLDPKAQAVIEGLQPYHRGNAYRGHPLWALHQLDNINKHRLLHTSVAWFGGFLLDTTKSSNWKIEPGVIESLGGVIGTDTPVARINLAPVDPNLAMHVHIDPAIADIAFARGTAGIQGEPVIKTVGDIYNYVLTDVLEPISPYLPPRVAGKGGSPPHLIPLDPRRLPPQLRPEDEIKPPNSQHPKGSG